MFVCLDCLFVCLSVRVGWYLVLIGDVVACLLIRLVVCWCVCVLLFVCGYGYLLISCWFG